LREIAGADWVLPNDQSAFHRQIEALFIVAGASWPANAILTNSMVSLKSIVMHGDSVAIMPRQLVALERQAGLLHCIDLVEAGAARALGLSRARDRKLSPVAQCFVDILRTCAQEDRSQSEGKAKPRRRAREHVATSRRRMRSLPGH
jgi:DNA-binding transcriptional LysR family regulator